jgi:hypothetical protein
MRADDRLLEKIKGIWAESEVENGRGKGGVLRTREVKNGGEERMFAPSF